MQRRAQGRARLGLSPAWTSPNSPGARRNSEQRLFSAQRKPSDISGCFFWIFYAFLHVAGRTAMRLQTEILGRHRRAAARTAALPESHRLVPFPPKFYFLFREPQGSQSQDSSQLSGLLGRGAARRAQGARPARQTGFTTSPAASSAERGRVHLPKGGAASPRAPGLKPALLTFL